MNRKMALIAAALAVAMVAIWYVALWRPANHQLAAATQHLNSAQVARLQASVQETALEKKRAQLPAERAKAQSLATAAPTDPDIAGVIDQINSVATATGVGWHSESQSQSAPTTSTSSSSSSKAAAALPSMGITLDVTGTYDQTLNFVSELQNMPRLVSVSALSLGGGAATGSSGGGGSLAVSQGTGSTLTTQITATIYQDPSPLPAPPATKS